MLINAKRIEWKKKARSLLIVDIDDANLKYFLFQSIQN